MSKFKWPLVLMLMALSAGVYFSPHWVVHQMTEAAQARDAERFSSYVDYPTLQANVRAQVRGRVSGRPDSPWAALRGMVASVITDPMVDALVTPEALSTLLTEGWLEPAPRHRRRPPPVRDDTGGANEVRPPEVSMRMAYAGLNRFEVQVHRPASSAQAGQADADVPAVFILSREGLLSWRLSGVRLPR